MNGETNENNETIGNVVDNAFSDLISQYFEEGNNTQNAGNIQQGPVLDWDAVTNGQLCENKAETVDDTTLGGVYGKVNLENTNLTNGGLYTNLETGAELNLETNNNNEQSIDIANLLYNELGNINTKGNTVEKVYGVVTPSGKSLKGVNTINTNQNINADTIGVENTIGTDFKLTQGNLPAKIGFWTKVRNFFRFDTKISYSAEQPTQNDTGAWNRLQNFFSFGKNK